MPQSSPVNSPLLDFARALANEKRQQMLLDIFTDKQAHTVGHIAERIGIAPSTASEHLAILKRAGVLTAEKRAKEVYYQINKARVAELLALIQNWLDCC